MQRHFDADLEKFNGNIIAMASLTEQAIEKAVLALKTRDRHLAQTVIDEDNRIDEFENELNEQGIDLLARYQPFAGDLRFIAMGMDVCGDLERIADMAVNIAYKVLDMADLPLLKPLEDIPRLSDNARRMVKEAIDAFVRRDEAMAGKVIESDQESDRLRNKIIKDIIEDFIMKDGSTAPRAIPLILVARDLERVSDHATAIAQDVFYLVSGRMVKHHPELLN